MTAYGRFKYPKSFFSRYRVESRPAGDEVEELPNVSGQIVTKVRLYVSAKTHVEMVNVVAHIASLIHFETQNE